MKKLEFETSKGRFVLIDKESITTDEFEAILYFKQVIKLSEITEEQASEIVDSELYDYVLFRGHLQNYCETAIESLHSLLESKGIHLFENPIDLDEQLDCNCDICYQQLENAFDKAEEKTFYNPYIFKL